VAFNQPDLDPLDYQVCEQCCETYHKLQPKLKTVLEFKEALQLIGSALPEKTIDNSVKDYRKRV